MCLCFHSKNTTLNDFILVLTPISVRVMCVVVVCVCVMPQQKIKCRNVYIPHHITHHTSHTTHHTSHITHHTSHITHHTSHITHHTSHITHHTPHTTHHTEHITHHTHHTSHITHPHLPYDLQKLGCLNIILNHHIIYLGIPCWNFHSFTKSSLASTQ
jgi:hypothetical protein